MKARRKNRILLCNIVLCILIFGCIPASAGKIDPLLVALRAQQKDTTKIFIGKDGNEYTSYSISLSNLKEIMDISDEKGELSVYTLIQTNGNFDRFSDFGIHTNTKIGNIYTAALTMEQLDSLAQQNDIIRIDASVKCELNLDTSLTAMGVNAAIDTFGLSGEGVIVGIIDKGMDIWNKDFQNLDDSLTRILYYFDVGDDSGPSPFSYGTEYTSSQINDRICGYQDYYGHGTAVMGIASGNGKNTKNGVAVGTFKGVAPKSSIICVDFFWSSISTGKIVDAVDYIFQKAETLQMPCVINISAGILSGPHDGSSPFEIALSDSGFNIGRAIINCAGNYNYDPLKPASEGSRWHARKNSYSYQSPQDTVSFFVGTDSMAQPQSSDEFVAIQIWYPAGQDFHVGLITPSGDSCGK